MISTPCTWCLFPLHHNSLMTFIMFMIIKSLMLYVWNKLSPRTLPTRHSATITRLLGCCQHLRWHHGKDTREYDERLRWVLQRLRETNLTLNAEKCRFYKTQMGSLWVWCWAAMVLNLPKTKSKLLGSLSNHEDDGNKNPTNLHIWQWKTVFLHALHVNFSAFDILKTFSFFLRRQMTCFAVVWTTWAYDDKCSILSSYVPSTGFNLIPG